MLFLISKFLMNISVAKKSPKHIFNSEKYNEIAVNCVVQVDIFSLKNMSKMIVQAICLVENVNFYHNMLNK